MICDVNSIMSRHIEGHLQLACGILYMTTAFQFSLPHPYLQEEWFSSLDVGRGERL